MKLNKMKLFCLLVIILFSIFIVSAITGYNKQLEISNTLKNQNTELRDNLKNSSEKKILKYFTDSIVDINIMHLNPNNLVDGLYATAGVYFCTIKKGTDKYILNELNKNSRVCMLWSSNSKEKYLQKFHTYNKDINESNTTSKKLYDCTLEGLNIVDSICSGT